MNVDRELPILDELGAEFTRLIEFDEARAAAPRTAPTPAPAGRLPGLFRGRRGRRPARVTRRVAVVLVLLCLVGGVALAARFGGGGGDGPAHTAPALLGRAGGGAWHVSAYRDQGRLCLLLALRDGPLTSDCGPQPGPTEVRATGLRDGSRRLVAGLTGPRVAAVAVRVGERTVRVGTRAADDRVAAEEAGVRSGDRWFVAPLVAGTGPGAAFVTPLGSDRRRLGPAYVDCSLGVVGAACRAQVRAAASAAARR
jgi:hypothetical protein